NTTSVGCIGYCNKECVRTAALIPRGSDESPMQTHLPARARVTPMLRSTLFALLLSTLAAACATTTGASDMSSIPSDSVESCTAQCESLGLEFDGVTIGDREVECVCEPE
ncbi:MAG: hypothetical protein AAF436_22425, partial [Myxococcota bacterium]